MPQFLSSHEMIKDFETRGFTSQQAEALVDWWIKIVGGNYSIATETREINSAINELKKDLTIKIYAGQALFILAVVLIALMLH